MPEPKVKEKRWSKDFEKEIYQKWKKSKEYALDRGTKKQLFSIDTPPPYVNTPVHMGQTSTYILMDMFARFHRMVGHEVLFPFGLDRNGLPIEMAAEKKFKVSPHTVSREKFVQMCKKVLESSSETTEDTYMRSGISFSSWEVGPNVGDAYLTDMDEYRKVTQATFIDMWKKGLIKQEKRVNNYCPGCRTTIADAEIDYKESSTMFNDIKFTIKETGEQVIIGTTRPELLAAIGMVIYNPDDKRYKKLKGKHAVIPIYGIEVPIKPHPYAKMDKGTGLMMMCSFGDYTDIRFFREQKLKPKILISVDGKMTKEAGFLQELPVKEARKKIIERLKNGGQLVKQYQVQHRAPICERSKHGIEFIGMPEYYLDQMNFLKEVLKVSDKTNFFAKKSKQILLDWVDSISMDWAISRRRYYATELPLWYCKNEKCKEVIVPPKGEYYKPWKDKPPIEKCPKCGGKEFIGEERVFDTWFDSSISPLFILGYGRDEEFFKKHFPCTLRPQGKEIVRTWLYYTLLRGFQLTGKPVFRDVWIHNHIVDEKGHKMSKSVGNIVNPQEVLDKYGAEPLRIWTASEGNITQTDLRCSFERIEGAGKFLTKLWNVARFVSMFPEPKSKPKLLALDEWIVNETNEIVKDARKRFSEYDFHNPSVKIKNFIWETFASHYLELVKNRAYNQENKFAPEEQESALWTLHYCIETILKVMAPIIPFATYKLYQELRGKDIHKESFPEILKVNKPEFSASELMELNSLIWKAKKDAGKSLKAEFSSLSVPEKFREIEKDLKATHSIKKLGYGKLQASL